MEKLTAADASFFYSETPRCSSNIASVQLMELPESVSPSTFVLSLKEFVLARKHLVTYMTRKPVFVPASLDHPVWVEDEGFDINNHIIEYPLPAPATWRQVEDAVAEVHNIKLPLDRPLWMFYVFTGLAGNKVAYYQSVHHAALDGASGNATYEVLMDETPEHPPVAPGRSAQEDEQVTALTLVESAFENFLRFQLESPVRLMGALDSSARLMRRSLNPSEGFGALGKTAPKTPFNGKVSEQRAWRTGEMPLADLKKMGKLLGATVNDIIMAVCAGGLRSYLLRHNALPEDSLIAGCPVSMRKPGDTSPGNQVSMMNVELATQIADPLERLSMIRASAKTAKEVTAELAGVYEPNAAFPGMPSMMNNGINAVESFGLADFFSGPINVVISNAFGPRATLYSNGARMMSHHPVSIVAQGIGVNITVQSYVDQVYLGLTTCAKAVPDADLLRDDLIAAFEELKARLLPQNLAELKPKAAAPVASANQESNSEVAVKVA